jgi:uncharacterized membrane protein YraQ (UPF0718 family)
MEFITEFLKNNPHYAGLLFVFFGILFLLATIYDWDCLFKNDVSGVTCNLKKIDGWINLFGRKAARVFVAVMSVSSIIGGMVWFWIYSMKQ